jgi:sialate O-acetylesterase
VLFAGIIDDVDEVYLNGEQIGTVKELSRKDKRYSYTGYNFVLRAYDIPNNLLNKGSENHIEIIVRDHTGLGGIYDGPIGITDSETAKPIINKSLKDRRSSFRKLLDYWFD